jgi:hypothetical protein
VGPPSGKGGRHIRGAPQSGAPRLYISVEHHSEVRHGYVVPTTIKVPLPPTSHFKLPTPIDLALALVPLLSPPPFSSTISPF